MTEPTSPAKTARRAEEGVGPRDMAERFLKKRIEEGEGTDDGLCLAIPSAKHGREQVTGCLESWIAGGDECGARRRRR